MTDMQAAPADARRFLDRLARDVARAPRPRGDLGVRLEQLARRLAQLMHEGQVRKGTGEPYFNHPARVAAALEGWEEKTVAYLHDLVEDTPIELSDLRLLGFPASVIEAVDLLTQREGETYREFIIRCADSGSRLALRVKLADLTDNLRDIHLVPGATRSFIARYEWAREVIVSRLERVADDARTRSASRSPSP